MQATPPLRAVTLHEIRRQATPPVKAVTLSGVGDSTQKGGHATKTPSYKRGSDAGDSTLMGGHTA